MACSVAGRNGYAAIRVSIVGNVFYHSKGLTGCTGGPLVSGPAGRHRWPVARHVSGPAGLRYNRHYQDAGYNRFRRRDSERQA